MGAGALGAGAGAEGELVVVGNVGVGAGSDGGVVTVGVGAGTVGVGAGSVGAGSDGAGSGGGSTVGAVTLGSVGTSRADAGAVRPTVAPKAAITRSTTGRSFIPTLNARVARKVSHQIDPGRENPW
jgi:hypothetical protein